MGARDLDGDIGDFDSGDYDHTEVVRRVSDVWHPSFMAASAPVTACGPTATGRALAKEALAAAKRLEARQLADAEAVRAAYWNRLPQRMRMMACHMAGIDAKKGKGPLLALDAAERARVHAEIGHMLRFLPDMQRCCTGGRVNDHGEMAAHRFDGIAAKTTLQ
ncbi:hypothetical protein RY831_27705 [Noviherbaspirillum sp. CPCC 100848]|uniref:Uncharacterized protein n=1 Tax=Noviherbaspirillum album TaxID=3080276 RepID=A0ABU6JI39_9BURK|nr:hypothetical protein [Noviherbaspirillum sp. CPCC 100848]MEC4722950.1 hypothetical protein [Noviherbaspirillum sp. CPCC 100848]